MLRKRLSLIISGCLLLFLCFHFYMTAVYLSPQNYYKQKIESLITAYINPLFKQNWRLFAPNPVNQHKDLQARVRYTDRTGKVRESEWYDISKSLVRGVQTNRFSSQFRLLEYRDSLISSFLSKNEKNRERAEELLGGFASYVVQKDWKVDGKVSEVRVRVVTNTFPRFKERQQPDSKGKLHYYYTDWLPYEPLLPGGKGGTP
ncbi:DUF5819 family protein [Paenactinomyces guangxiensis]|uniref:Uncharacterized protein n=1 Tax=Paenactinomyces guangxiensis TaxID=1490290 RepID=A0A7W2A8N5_9BACL|nr:DUF5819 family protein [Paenactinomyces guangxiensis]MBA4495781.1 hypothetical protein [Paenactinomyces guangxiensis]MBH8592871.1 hypothetical protein [Paenactinomyces guangxiensis]